MSFFAQTENPILLLVKYFEISLEVSLWNDFTWHVSIFACFINSSNIAINSNWLTIGETIITPLLKKDN